MPVKKYNFIPENQLNNENVETGLQVTITKLSLLYFSPSIVQIYDLDKKIIRLYVDVEKKSIAWTEVTEGDISVLKNVRVLRMEPTAKSVTISVARALTALGITKEMLPIKKLPVTTYKDSLVENEFYVIDLSEYIKNNHASY